MYFGRSQSSNLAGREGRQPTEQLLPLERPYERRKRRADGELENLGERLRAEVGRRLVEEGAQRRIRGDGR